ncbi:TIR domain-containing protein [Pseudomonas syringae group sp. 247E2]|uniref:TIR domain-containing protein n=1 Tax=Pseudomonas syringae group sp. 247E2 TaxID=3079592 RepID=UPI00291235D9|nr:TIR domain-containing protein [Pseudomonas syringae group sp. 247E2]MDU8604690.1 nucleotide-binding protein [Pseudomonas syringae group sp. 247E2]
MAQEAIIALDQFEKLRDSKDGIVFSIIRKVGVPCLDGTVVKKEVLEDIPLRAQMDFSNSVFSMVNLQSLRGGGGNEAIRSSILFFKRIVTELSVRTKRHGTPRIFYSWQSTLEGNANRNFIRKCLSQAIDSLNQELEVEGRDEAMLDSDTANTPGSPDIIRTILSKVDESTIFVADITMVNDSQPNSNVMFELGYALKALGESNIVLLFNEHYGSPKDLPFDLGLKRAMLYRCSPEEENKAPIRKELSVRLKGAIDMILKDPGE